MFKILEYPYVRAQTYTDDNPPAVLADEFYNPTQDNLARLFGACAGYSTSISYEEFAKDTLAFTSAVGALFGNELAIVTPGGGQYTIESTTPAGPNEHGVWEVRGTAAGDRGGIPGFQTRDASRYVGELRWIFRCRIRCSKFAVLETAADGLVVGLGTLASGLPVWLANGSDGFWSVSWEGSSVVSTLPVVDGEWVTLWISLEEGDGVVRWYAKRDADPLPVLYDTRTLGTPSLVNARRYIQYIVDGTAVAADNIQVDNISLGVER
ncbi:MAG: hypothetical protein E6Q97_36270 [Desulfurellales bacterium]|nr:MAG: hypothetical protein E6Q97_36270 [Desulfurellales bacterium]